jgi:hypothetical protein
MFTGSPDKGTTSQPIHFNPNIPVQPNLPPGPSEYTSGTEPHEIFTCRLKWSILDNPSNAELLSLDAEGKRQWTPLFTDSTADQASTNPPVSRLVISVNTLEEWEHWSQAQEEPPASGLIENTDGRPITVRQLLEGFYDYALPLRRVLCRCCDIWSAEGEARTQFYFTLLWLYGSDPESGHPDAVASVDVTEDMDEEGDNWASQLELMETLYRKGLASK